MPEDSTVGVSAPAKINLFLRILAKEEGGYHQLETLYSAIDVCDKIVIGRTKQDITMDVVGASLGRVEDNLVYRAASAFLDAAAITTGVHVQLTKNIPVAAGLGGGSSDAGATLRALNALHGGALSHTELLSLAGALGTDVPFFVSKTGAALAWGRGERFLPVSLAPGLVVLLACPSIQISTSEAYGHLDVRHRTAPASFDVEHMGHLEVLSEMAENDFEASVFERHPELDELRGAMDAAGAHTARLSGSGSALFGLFGDLATTEQACDSLSTGWPTVRFVVTKTLAFKPGPSLRSEARTL